MSKRDPVSHHIGATRARKDEHLQINLADEVTGLRGAFAVMAALRHRDLTGAGSNATRCIGVLVDAVEGTEEVLVRTLGRHAGRWYGVAGATELRDGTVALVLDLPRLLSGSEI